VEKILGAYHTLWRIEESFHIMKSTLEARPIFHWTERRIKGHFAVCFLAFLLERTLECKLREAGVDASPQAIQEALNSLNFTKVEIEGQRFLIKTQSSDLSKKILRLMHIAPPKNITPSDKVKYEANETRPFNLPYRLEMPECLTAFRLI